MKDGGKLPSVGFYDMLLSEYASVFYDAHLLHVKFDVGCLDLDVNFILGMTFIRIDLTTLSDERLLDLPGFRVREVDHTA